MSIRGRALAALLAIWLLPGAAPGALPAPKLVVAASPSIRNLKPERGQRYVRLAPLDDGRVIAAFTQGYQRNCGLMKGCAQRPEVWHLVFNKSGLVAGPFRTSPELDAKPDINTVTILPNSARRYAGGTDAIIGLGHSSHNAGGGHFARIDRDGVVRERHGGEGSYDGKVCVLDRDVIVLSTWVDPVSTGYLWYDKGTTLGTTVHLGGYGYNFTGLNNLACGPSRALGGNFALILRKQGRSHIGFSLYRAPGKFWSLLGQEVRLPMSGLPAVKTNWGGGVDVGDDRAVVMFMEASVDGRRNMFYARFRLTPQGVNLVDKRPVPMPMLAAYEGLDGNLVYGGNGRFYLALYQAGESAAGQPPNRRQAVRFYQLDFETGLLTQIAQAYEDGNWSGRPPLSYYAESWNVEAFSLARSCDGNLYVGGAIDGGKGPSVLRIFSVPVGVPSCL